MQKVADTHEVARLDGGIRDVVTAGRYSGTHPLFGQFDGIEPEKQQIGRVALCLGPSD